MAGDTAFNGPCYKALNFDLDTAKLKKHYSGADYTKAYKDIRKFLKSVGFEHRQGSGYRSVERLSDVDVWDVTANLYEQFPWFQECVNKFDVTDVGEMYDLMELYAEFSVAYGKRETGAKQAPHPDSKKAGQQKSVREMIRGAQRTAAENAEVHAPKRKKNTDYDR